MLSLVFNLIYSPVIIQFTPVSQLDMFFSFQIHADLNWEAVRNAKNNIQMLKTTQVGDISSNRR